MRAVGVATLNANSVKKQSINAKSEPSKCSGLAISRRRQNYAKIGVELMWCLSRVELLHQRLQYNIEQTKKDKAKNLVN